jgi:hypothetical protein
MWYLKIIHVICKKTNWERKKSNDRRKERTRNKKMMVSWSLNTTSQIFILFLWDNDYLNSKNKNVLFLNFIWINITFSHWSRQLFTYKERKKAMLPSIKIVRFIFCIHAYSCSFDEVINLYLLYFTICFSTTGYNYECISVRRICFVRTCRATCHYRNRNHNMWDKKHKQIIKVFFRKIRRMLD